MLFQERCNLPFYCTTNLLILVLFRSMILLQHNNLSVAFQDIVNSFER
jgi:hypothetical protein